MDFIYLNLVRFTPGDLDIFSQSYRFQNLEKINTKKLLEYAELFNSKKLYAVCKDFCRFVKKER